MLGKLWSKYTKRRSKKEFELRIMIEEEFPYLFIPKYPDLIFVIPPYDFDQPLDNKMYQWLVTNIRCIDWCFHHLDFGEYGGLIFRHEIDLVAFKLVFPEIF